MLADVPTDNCVAVINSPKPRVYSKTHRKTITLSHVSKGTVVLVLANQDILHDLWVRLGCECKGVSLSTIGTFALKNKNAFRSKTGLVVTTSGLNYAVLKFILEYTLPVSWPPNLWDEFHHAKDNKTGNYGRWKSYPNLLVSVQSYKENKKYPSSQLPQRSSTVNQELNTNRSSTAPIRANRVPKPDSQFVHPESPEMDHYLNWIVNIIDELQTPDGKGWLGLLHSYKWPAGKGSFEEGIANRIAFHYLVNRTAEASGMGAKEYRQGLYTAIAGWGGIDKIVGEVLAEKIFSSILYLKSIGESDHIDPNRICGERIATSSKVYYFSSPQLWTIYDSRIAFALHTLAEKYAVLFPETATRLSEIIRFSIPGNRKGRSNPTLPWNNDNAAPSFVRASLLLRSITSKLNTQKIPPPDRGVISSGAWELCHVEMALFMQGQ